MAEMTTFHEMERKQGFGGFGQEVPLEPGKEYNALELYLDDLMEYLYPQMEEMIRGKGRGIIFWWSVQVKYSRSLMKTVDYDDEENWFRCQDDETTMTLTMMRTARSICTRGDTRSRIENSWLRGWQRPDISSLNGRAAASEASRMWSLIQLEMCVSKCSITTTNSSVWGTKTDKAGGVVITRQLLTKVFAQNFNFNVIIFDVFIVGICFQGSDQNKTQ